jgi:hypothetical protein
MIIYNSQFYPTLLFHQFLSLFFHFRTTLIGNPELRFQPNEGVQKSIINNIRYTADRGTKEAYQNVLGKQLNIRLKKGS